MLGLPVNPTLGRLKQEDREFKDLQREEEEQEIKERKG